MKLMTAMHSLIERLFTYNVFRLNTIITGCCWHDMPRCYGAYQTAWRRLKRWSKEGVWSRILVAAQKQAYAVGKLSLETVAVDSTLIDSKKVANQSDITDISDARV